MLGFVLKLPHRIETSQAVRLGQFAIVMAAAKRKAREVASSSEPRRSSMRSAKNIKTDAADEAEVKMEDLSSPEHRKLGLKRAAKSTPGSSQSKRIKRETGLPSPSESDEKSPSPSPKTKSSPSKASANTKSRGNKADELQAKKLKSYSQFANKSPFPDFGHPTPDESKLAHRILASMHGERKRPAEVVAPSKRAGCGDSPSVLDALVRTILSQNTSDKNSTRAKLNMDKVYGGSDKWDAIVDGGEGKLQKAIESGGLSVVKSKVIISILKQTKEKYGKYSLDHLFEASNEDAMKEMLAFQGVGPKTASCVLLFCLRRESFAVDTHVHRITGLLGWRPKNASRDETHAHLDALIPDEDKYGLHILLVSHGKRCEECKAGGKNLGKCELRKAFRKGKLQGEAGDDIKDEELEVIKKEEPGIHDDQDAFVHGMEQVKGKKKSKR